MILKCKNYGFLATNTEVENKDGRVLVTNGLTIKELAGLWRWYYKVSAWDIIFLEIDEKNYNYITKSYHDGLKSVAEMFKDEGVIVIKGNSNVGNE